MSMKRPRRFPSALRHTLTSGLLLASMTALHATPPDAPRAASGADAATVEVWVQLSLPELSSVPAPDRAAARRRIAEQQDTVMAALRDLGAVEQARVQLVRNALAVTLPRAALKQARAIPGVRAITPVRHRDLHRP